MGWRDPEGAYHAGEKPKDAPGVEDEPRRIVQWLFGVLLCSGALLGVYGVVSQLSQESTSLTAAAIPTSAAEPIAQTALFGGSFDAPETEESPSDEAVDVAPEAVDEPVTTTEPPEPTEEAAATEPAEAVESEPEAEATATEEVAEEPEPAEPEETAVEPEAEIPIQPEPVPSPIASPVMAVWPWLPAGYQLVSEAGNILSFDVPTSAAHPAVFRMSNKALKGNPADDLQTLIDGDCLYEDGGHAPTIRIADAGSNSTTEGEMQHEWRVYQCPSMDWSFAWWHADNGFSADTFFVGTDMPDLTGAILGALSPN